MQIQMFPDPNAPDEIAHPIQCGQVGPLRFAATATSYPHLTRLLADLVSDHEAVNPSEGVRV